ncbi:hypothetical protein ACQ3G6_17160, partial [Allorhizobium undicola]|uniref:hypothetical protein n=1 Tax=Allorhizobium undicola TaxID=78527 RepID=UPI003D344A9E
MVCGRLGQFVYPAGNGVRPHAPTSINGVAFTYDANGNLVSDGTRALAYDPANRISSVTSGGAETSFVYGPDGARAQKTGPQGTTSYHDANVEYDPTDGIFTRYPHMCVKVVGSEVYR